MLKLLKLVAIFTIAIPAAASQYTYYGDTTDADSWYRLQNGGSIRYDVRPNYSAFKFNVSVSGEYEVMSYTKNSIPWDNYLILYKNTFDPKDQKQGFLQLNDDYPEYRTLTQSGFASVHLDSEDNYFLVTTGFGTYNYGAFINTISGPGFVYASSVSEPGTITLALLGLIFVINKRQRHSISRNRTI